MASDSSRHVIIVKEDAPLSITLAPLPSSSVIGSHGWRNMQGLHRISIVNRGEPITFHSSDPVPSEFFPYVLNVNKELNLSDSSGIVTGWEADFKQGDNIFFIVDHFDMIPRVLSDHIHSDNDRLHGIIAFSCDWEGTRTVELWVDGTTKLVKFQNIASGQHVLEYSIPGPVVKGWSREGTRMVPLELRTTFNTFERILWSGATLAVKTALPQG